MLEEIADKNITIYRTDKDPFAKKPKKNNPSENITRPYPSKLKQKLQQFFLQSIFIPDSRIRWKKYALQKADEIFEEHSDIAMVFATAPPFTDFIIANELSKKYDVPFVVDYRDL
jgi:hypothetical protein